MRDMKNRGERIMKRNRKIVFHLLLSLIILLSVGGLAFAGGKQEAEPAAEEPVEAAPAEEEKEPFVLGINNYMDSFEFCYKVHQSIEEAAAKAGIKVVYAEAQMEPERIKSNLDTFAIQGVDAIFEFNWTPDVTKKFMDQNPGIVMITGDYKAEGSYYFGADNYGAGLILGRYLAEEVDKRWGGVVDSIVLGFPPVVGETIFQRMQGVVDGYRETHPEFSEDNVFSYDTMPDPTTVTRQFVTDFLTAHPDQKHIVIASNNDEGGLGALSAVETQGRESDVLIVSHGADTPFREKIRAGKGDLWIGSVAYRPEKYGDYLIPALLDILEGRSAPMEILMEHVVVTKDNIDLHYPGE